MEDKKISELTSSGAIGGTEELPIVQSGSTVKTTINAIKTFLQNAFIPYTGATQATPRIRKLLGQEGGVVSRSLCWRSDAGHGACVRRPGLHNPAAAGDQVRSGESGETHRNDHRRAGGQQHLDPGGRHRRAGRGDQCQHGHQQSGRHCASDQEQYQQKGHPEPVRDQRGHHHAEPHPRIHQASFGRGLHPHRVRRDWD